MSPRSRKIAWGAVGVVLTAIALFGGWVSAAADAKYSSKEETAHKIEMLRNEREQQFMRRSEIQPQLDQIKDDLKETRTDIKTLLQRGTK